MFITGPDVIKTVTHEEVTMEELGGAHTHATTSGVSHRTFPSEAACIAGIRELLSYLPQNNTENPPAVESKDPIEREDAALDTIVPDSMKPYDIKTLVSKVVDDGKFFEIPRRARAQHRRRARAHRWTVRRRRRQPARAPRRGARHRQLGQGRALRPLLRLLQHPTRHVRRRPGFSPGVKQEYGGIIKHGAKLLYAYVEATVPKVTIITRKAYGGAYDVMASKHVRADINFAYSHRRDRRHGSRGRGQHRLLERPQKAADPAAARAAYMAEYKEKFANPYAAAALGYIDEVIRPRETRKRSPSRCACSATSARPTRRRSTATSRCSHPDPG